jgi:thiol-disulfide isomerase/thioredoxin|tara:strand:+ start:1434 stop:1985 length:552 start_codon:yes stop_codon:yes gene_type:complete
MTRRLVILLLGVMMILSCDSKGEPERVLGKFEPKKEALVPSESKVKGGRLSGALDWNEEGIAWTRYDSGLEEARANGKPILALVYADWCAHCKKYGENFFESKIEDISKKYVMVLVNQDKEPATSRYLSPDGIYVPRTFILSSEGEIRDDIFAVPSRFQFFYDYRSPDNILNAMKKGLSKPKT